MRSPPDTLFAAPASYVQCEEHEEGGVNTLNIGLVIVLRPVETVVVELISVVFRMVR